MSDPVPSQNARQLADSHLTYIGASRIGTGAHAVYDVYGPGRGPQLGTVERYYATWRARDNDGNEKVSDARWKAATALWGVWHG